MTDPTPLPDDLAAALADDTTPNPAGDLSADLPWLTHPGDTDHQAQARQDYREAHAALSGAYTPTDDALISDLRALRAQRDQAEATMRRLVAYARTAAPNPDRYTLRALADALHMPLTTVRVMYGPSDIAAVSEVPTLTEDQRERLWDAAHPRTRKE